MSKQHVIEVTGHALHLQRTRGTATAAQYCLTQGMPLQIALMLLVRPSYTVH